MTIDCKKLTTTTFAELKRRLTVHMMPAVGINPNSQLTNLAGSLSTLHSNVPNSFAAVQSPCLCTQSQNAHIPCCEGKQSHRPGDQTGHLANIIPAPCCSLNFPVDPLPLIYVHIHLCWSSICFPFSGFALLLSWVIFRGAYCVSNLCTPWAVSCPSTLKTHGLETCCWPDVEKNEIVELMWPLASLSLTANYQYWLSQLAVKRAWMMLFRFIVDIFWIFLRHVKCTWRIWKGGGFKEKMLKIHTAHMHGQAFSEF